MHQGLFNYENSIWKTIGKLGDLMLLNLLWIVCSIPVFTIGASTTAVYYVTLKLVRDEEPPVIKYFFRSFATNFRQATILWLLLVVAGTVLIFDFWFFFSGGMGLGVTVKYVICAILGGLMLIGSFIISYVFALQARFYNTVGRTLLNAFFMSVRHLFRTFVILSLDILIPAAACVSLFYIPQITMILFLLGFPLVAFVNSFFFNSIFSVYILADGQEPGLLFKEDRE